ncbi:UNVERIFIED_CONTAM: putative magnesium transporter NIPA1 [Sesamum angustifolium]|uniref:Probable magnesium transporter n=1 Tax=Sesamum angustifolium TaxID=2727405 RepID=A0AAW2PSJ7_9LAMI
MVGVSDNIRGFFLAISSSIFIGSSFIIKKKGLKRAGAAGTRASDGGYSYLKEPWWWAGMITMILGEGLNFAAYAYAPAILVTPLGALSIIFRIPFFKSFTRSVYGSQRTSSWFIVYTLVVLVVVIVLIVFYVPRYGQSHMVVYIGICSLMGSLTVMGVKAVAIALKLSFTGSNQFIYFETWFFTILVIAFCFMQMNISEQGTGYLQYSRGFPCVLRHVHYPYDRSQYDN